MRPSLLKLLLWSYLGAVLLINAVLFWNARDRVKRGYPDFTIYYTAGTMLRRGLAGQMYDNIAQFRIQQEFAGDVATRLGALPFNHPPIEAVLFAPFSYFSFPVAYLVWLFANLAMLGALPILLRPYVPLLSKRSNTACLLISLTYFPAFFALVQGQDSILLLLTYVLAYVSIRRDRLQAAGGWLACGLFKFHLVLPFLALLLIQQKSLARAQKVAFGFLAVAALLALISVAAVGPHEILAYPHFVLSLEAEMAQGAILPSDMPNIRGALYLLASQIHHFDGFALSLAAAVFVGAVAVLRQTRPRTEGLKISLALLVTFLVAYHGLAYDLCIVGFACLLLLDFHHNQSPPRPWTRALTFIGLAGLFFSPLQMILLIRYNRLGWLAWALFAATAGVAGEILLSPREPASPTFD